MFNEKFKSFLGIYIGTLSCIVKLPVEVCASHTKRVGDNKTVLYNSRSSQKCCSLVYPFKNILYNYLTGSVGKRLIAKDEAKREDPNLFKGRQPYRLKIHLKTIEGVLF